MATWPATLPQNLLIDALERETQEGMIRSQMDTGPAKQRARFTAVSRFYNASLEMTQTQRTAFDTFYETTLGFGADSFTWADPFTDASATCRIIDKPQTRMIAGSDVASERQYIVKFTLEILP